MAFERIVPDHRRQKRRWRFANALFDEGSWTVFVNGQPVALETKPIELLRALLLRPGEVVSKDELLDAAWPGIAVVEASLTTAVLKLRRALGDDDPDQPIIKTVPRLGYRLASPVVMEDAARPVPAIGTDLEPRPVPRRGRRLMFAGVLLATLAACALAAMRTFEAAPSGGAAISRLEVIEALRSLDIPHVRNLLSRGWDPNSALDPDHNTAMGLASEICEWNPGHDRQRLMLLVRLLADHGERVDERNRFGDTPYSIAAATRFCGPNHPVTRLLYTLCFHGATAPGARCLARYATAHNRLTRDPRQSDRP